MYRIIRYIRRSGRKSIVDRIIDLVELIEKKGGRTSVKDICKLQEEWRLHEPNRKEQP